MKIIADVATAREKGRLVFWRGILLALPILLHTSLVAVAHAGMFSELKVEISKAPLKKADKAATGGVPGRLVSYQNGYTVFRAPSLGQDIPIKASNGNPFQDNINKVFAKDQNAWEVISTVPVSIKLPNDGNQAVELQSNVDQVWNQISADIKNRVVADNLQRYVRHYEANAAKALAESSNGWTGTVIADSLSERAKAKPENVAQLQRSIASDIFRLSGSSTTPLSRDDFAAAAALYQAADPDQFFGSYGPVSINWSLDDLRRFARFASSVASISYMGDIKGTGFLVGDGLVLTCDHVANLVDLNAAKATFQPLREGDPAITLNFETQPVLKSSTLSLTSKLSNKKLRCDFALLKLKDNKQLSDAGILPLEIRKENLLNAVVAVIGFPEPFKKLTVHDNGTMLFPYLLPRKEFQTVYTQRVIRSLNVGASPAAKNEAAFEADMRIAQETFRTAYGYRDDDDPDTNYYYVGWESDWQGIPSFGVDTSDTHGDSGGPVFDKSSLKVIGIMEGGPPGSYARGASWLTHDRVVPMSEIIDAITQANPNVLATYKVTVTP